MNIGPTEVAFFFVAISMLIFLAVLVASGASAFNRLEPLPLKGKALDSVAENLGVTRGFKPRKFIWFRWLGRETDRELRERLRVFVISEGRRGSTISGDEP